MPTHLALTCLGGVFDENQDPPPPPPLHTHRQRMLVKAPAKRMSADEACAHPWITKHRPRQSLSAPPKDKDGPGSVPQAQAMTERGGEEGAEEQSTPLDPKLVRRLTKFAVRMVGLRAGERAGGGGKSRAV